MKTVEERVKALVVDQLGVEPVAVTGQAHFVDDLGADSLDAVELTMAIEESFDIEIPDGEAEKFEKVGDVVRYVEAEVAKTAAS
jgi:acyl carrier protein